MSARIVGIIAAVLIIALLFPAAKTLWGLDQKIDGLARSQHEMVLAIGRLERQLEQP